MHEVTAWADAAGRLHKDKRNAMESDFLDMVRKAWGSIPERSDHGDPVSVARMLASNVYPNFRYRLRDAIAWLDKAESE